jgi:hypothetical protein
MPTYTRTQLRDGVTASANLTTGAKTFTLVNNVSTTSYFIIEGTTFSEPSSPYGGIAYRQIFNSASVTSLVNCTIITESVHAAFIVNPSSTATFSFTPSVTIPAAHIKFIAANPTILSGSTSTVYGIELSTP